MFARQSPIAGQVNRARSMRRRMNHLERRLWKELRKLDANFRRQAPIGPYFADFAAYSPKLVIEVDGGVHERLESVQLRDAERQRWLEADGFTVLRFSDREVSDVHACIDKVRALLLKGGGLGGGEGSELMGEREWAPAPNGVQHLTGLRTPPSPALPPSRRKGAVLFRGADLDA